MRADLEIIENWIRPNSRVLDLGCGDGLLLTDLQKIKNIRGVGIDFNHQNVVACINNKVNIIQSDIENGLKIFKNLSFDLAILSQTIQAIHTTEYTLNEMLRVAKEAIVTLPNFGFYQQRWMLLKGIMPISKSLPYQWFNTPNVRYCTINDFVNLCRKLNFNIIDKVILNEAGKIISFMPNLLGSVAIFRISQNKNNI